jgi:thioredoxin-related protein
MRRLLYLTIVLPLLLNAQSKGIKFQEIGNWQQVLERAKIENKFVFVECYATWCGPCKAMDKSVFPVEKVGDIVNKSFVTIKVQMDTSKYDNHFVRSWYAEANSIMTTYQIVSLPSFLFFSPNGELVHRDVGYKDVSSFLEMINNSTVEERQICTLLKLYKQGIRDYKNMPYLVNSLKHLKESHLAKSIARDYLDNYLYKKSDLLIIDKENIEFVRSNIESSKEKGFQVFYEMEHTIDSIVGESNYSQKVIDYIISKEEVDPRIPKNGFETPNWNALYKIIKNKYNDDYAKRNVLNAKIRWYHLNKKWDKLASSYIIKNDKYGYDTSSIGRFMINNFCWEVIFKHLNRKQILSKGVQMMEMVISLESTRQSYVDTYANLLYKLGKKNKAIEWQRKAVQLEDESAAKLKIKPDKVYQDVLDSMLADRPTWPTESLAN